MKPVLMNDRAETQGIKNVQSIYFFPPARALEGGYSRVRPLDRRQHGEIRVVQFRLPTDDDILQSPASAAGQCIGLPSVRFTYTLFSRFHLRSRPSVSIPLSAVPSINKGLQATRAFQRRFELRHISYSGGISSHGYIKDQEGSGSNSFDRN